LRPLQTLHFSDSDGFSLRPFVYGTAIERDLATMSRNFVDDPSTRYCVRLFVVGDPYSLLDLIDTNVHLFGVDSGGTIYLMGTDDLGRDVFSRILYGGAISLSVGLVGVILSFVVGVLLGDASGYYGGAVDTLIQRIVEFLISMPTIPLWMGLIAAVPTGWDPVKTYFTITLILALTSWPGLALIVHMMLAVPGMILAETSLSFLGLRLRAPVVSWGTMLQAAQNAGATNSYPWLMWAAAFVVATIMAFNFMGHGLRDATDTYKV